MRFLTTSQMARLFFNDSRWSANKRLRKLFDSGLVKAWLRSLSQQNVYSLTQKGRRLLKEEIKAAIKAPRGLEGNLDHLLAINQVRISFALGLPKINGEISWWASDWELRARGKERIIPDALYKIKWEASGEQSYALEVDNHTKSPRNFLKKILGYASLTYQHRGLYGVSDFLLLVVGKDPKWIERYRLALSRTRIGSRIWFATLEGVNERGAIAPIWKSVDGEKTLSLREVSFLPYGKETSGQENYTISAT